MKEAYERLIPLTRMRKAIVNSMGASAAVPQFTLEFEADLTALSSVRAQLKDANVRLSYTDVLIAASAGGLRAHPRINASFTDDGIVEHGRINIGLAIHLPDGLITPAVLDADRLSLLEIASERQRLTASASAGTLTPQEVLNTTFTISNLGTVGVRRFRALVVPPQSAILAVGTVTQSLHISLSLSCDHRVIDGMPAALFLRELVAYLEHPGWVLTASAPGSKKPLG
jgi:pyruvate dehydrogenase E2 component (dihydrolipoamide acetyltransferase)